MGFFVEEGDAVGKLAEGMGGTHAPPESWDKVAFTEGVVVQLVKVAAAVFTGKCLQN